jgi:hypothetical protein
MVGRASLAPYRAGLLLLQSSTLCVSDILGHELSQDPRLTLPLCYHHLEILRNIAKSCGAEGTTKVKDATRSP